MTGAKVRSKSRKCRWSPTCVGKGRELAGHFDRQRVEPFGVWISAARQMRDQRLETVHDLKQQIIVDLGDASGAGGGKDACRERLPPMVKQPLQFGDQCGQSGHRAADEAGGNVTVVQHNVAIRPDLDDPRETEREKTGPLVCGEGKAQAQLADPEDRSALASGIGVGGFVFELPVTRGRFGSFEQINVEPATVTHRQNEVYDAVACVIGDLNGRRVIDILGDGERRAILKNSPARAEAEFADGQKLTIDLELRYSPRVRRELGDARTHQLLDIAVLLLKVLRPKEHAFGPNYLIVPRHNA